MVFSNTLSPVLFARYGSMQHSCVMADSRNSSDLDRLVKAIEGHGDQLGGNLVYLKVFLQKQQNEQQAFMAEQREASDRAQATAHRAALFSAIAAGAAAIAAILQAYDALSTH